MSAYLIAEVDVTDPVQYEKYKILSTAAMKAHGAELCVRGGAVVALEGAWHPERMVMLKFPTVATAQAFYDSPDYAQARAARTDAAHVKMLILQGV